MQLQKYSFNQQFIETVLAWVQSGEIAMKGTDQNALEAEIQGLLDGLHGLPAETFFVAKWE